MAFQLGATFNYVGESKHISINGLIGDYFSVHSHTNTTIIAGYGVTIPDNIFKSNTEITLGASLGAGVKFNKVNLGAKSTQECGYRFYYLDT